MATIHIDSDTAAAAAAAVAAVGQPWSCLRTTASCVPDPKQDTTKTTMDSSSLHQRASSRDSLLNNALHSHHPEQDNDFYSPTFPPPVPPWSHMGGHYPLSHLPFDNAPAQYYANDVPQPLQGFDLSNLSFHLRQFHPDPLQSTPISYHMLESPSTNSPSSGFSPLPTQRRGDDFTPDSASPKACYGQCSDAQECADQHCQVAEYGIVECTEPSCTLENSSCGGDMPSVAVKAATYLQSAPLIDIPDNWHFGNENLGMDFDSIHQFGNYQPVWPQSDHLQTSLHDSIPLSTLPEPRIMEPFLDGGNETMEHRPKRRREDMNFDSQTSFSAQPMIGELTNSGLNSQYVKCFWTDCTASFDTPMARDHHVHLAHFHPQITVPCAQNGCPDFSGTDLSTHLKRKHDLMISDEGCFIENCSFDPNGNLGLEQHVDQKHSIPVGKGLECGWESCDASSLPSAHELANHLEKDHAVRIWASHQCQWKDEGSDAVCGKRFESPKELQEHTKTAHLAGLSKKVGYICRWDGCDRASKTEEAKLAFAQRGKLERHMQSHTKYKACTCEICHKDFSAEQALEQHMRTHNGTKPFRCEFPGCNKAFAQASALTMHNRTHTGEKPLKCPECGKQFAESSNLSKHRKTHNKVGEYACHEIGCGKTFHRPEQLRKHKERHAKIRETTLRN